MQAERLSQRIQERVKTWVKSGEQTQKLEEWDEISAYDLLSFPAVYLSEATQTKNVGYACFAVRCFDGW